MGGGRGQSRAARSARAGRHPPSLAQLEPRIFPHPQRPQHEVRHSAQQKQNFNIARDGSSLCCRPVPGPCSPSRAARYLGYGAHVRGSHSPPRPHQQDRSGGRRRIRSGSESISGMPLGHAHPAGTAVSLAKSTRLDPREPPPSPQYGNVSSPAIAAHAVADARRAVTPHRVRVLARRKGLDSEDAPQETVRATPPLLEAVIATDAWP